MSELQTIGSDPILAGVTLSEYLELLWHGRPYCIIGRDSIHYKRLSKVKSETFVIENEAWCVGFNEITLPALDPGLYRCWSRQDWTTADNARRARLESMEARQAAYKAAMAAKRLAVASNWSKNGLVKQAIDMMLTALTDEQISQIFETIPK